MSIQKVKLISKLTEAFTKLISSQNTNKLAARYISYPENFDHSDFEDDHEEENDGQNGAIIH